REARGVEDGRMCPWAGVSNDEGGAVKRLRLAADAQRRPREAPERLTASRIEVEPGACRDRSRRTAERSSLLARRFHLERLQLQRLQLQIRARAGAHPDLPARDRDGDTPMRVRHRVAEAEYVRPEAGRPDAQRGHARRRG